MNTAHDRNAMPCAPLASLPSCQLRDSASNPASSKDSTQPHAKLKAPSIDSTKSDNEKPTHPVPAKTSAYALLALMTSVHQAADERNRTRDVHTTMGTSARISGTSALKRRKPTQTARKEEILNLHDEITQLEKRLAFLKGQTITHAHQTDAIQGSTDPEHPFIPNALLREAIYEQQLSLASAQSMISLFFASGLAWPAHCYIHLTKSRADRLRVLHAVKPQQLRVARRYMVERSRHLDLTKPHAIHEQFLSVQGDTCSIRFSLVQFPDTISVRQVFDATTFYTTNLDISFTDSAGRLTIREGDDENDDPTVAHHRVLTAAGPDLQVEANLTMFSHYDDDADVGIVTSTYVDRDELHPYRPHECVRQDVTAASYITREHNCIVMRRLSFVRIHANERHSIDLEVGTALCDGVSQWGDALVKYARQHCGIDELST